MKDFTMMSRFPSKYTQICTQCGLVANFMTCMAKYGKPPIKEAFDVSTFHIGTCDCCRRENIYVTQDRDFFYPDFKLINKNAWRQRIKGLEARQSQRGGLTPKA